MCARPEKNIEEGLWFVRKRLARYSRRQRCVLPWMASQILRRDESPRPTIVISFDGAQPAVIEGLIRKGKLPRQGGFATLISQGTRADRE